MSDVAAGKLAVELLGKFLDEAGPAVAALEECVQSFDVNRVNELSRALKGIAGTSGARELRDAAQRLETVSDHERTATPGELDSEMRAVARALEHVHITRRTWEERAKRDRSAFR
jgi:HPt (histidine-containing phosphotransfer) domain-containing protein